MHTPEGDEVSGKYLLRREDNHFVLGTCSDRYNIVDNEDMFAPFDETVKDSGAVYESPGLLITERPVGSVLDFLRDLKPQTTRMINSNNE